MEENAPIVLLYCICRDRQAGMLAAKVPASLASQDTQTPPPDLWQFGCVMTPPSPLPPPVPFPDQRL